MKNRCGPARNGNPAARVRATDGPFTETKELIGGGAFAHVRPRDEAPAGAARSLCVLCGSPVDLRVREHARANGPIQR